MDEVTDTPTEPQPGSWLLPGRIYYKTDEETANGRYSAPGQRVSLYAG